MKLLAFSDLHRDQDAAHKVVAASAKADIAIGAGDFATRRIGGRDTLDILAHCAAPLILVHGNHDDPDEIAQWCHATDDAHYIHGNSVTLNSQTFFGLGGEIPTRNSHNWNTYETEEHAAQLLQVCPKNTVLITHTPPFGLADLQKNGSHEGSIAIFNAIDLYTPKLLLCGHIHNAWGMTGMHDATPVHNLGPTLNWFDLAT